MPKKNTVRSAYLALHMAVLLFGLSAIFGDLISLPSLSLVWWRLLFTCLSILFLIRVWDKIRAADKGLLVRMIGIGIIVALHWITFFGSIKQANASVALVCLATTAFFTALIEPFIMKQRWKGYEMMLGLAMVPGMNFVVQGVPDSMVSGIWLGLLSAIFIATFASLNKQLIHRADPIFITFVELGSGWLFISAVFAFMSSSIDFWPVGMDWIYLLALAILCTTVGYVLALKAMRQLSAFIAMLTMNLEPVYGMILAWFLLDDATELTGSFYIGVAIILVSIFIHPYLKRKYSK